MSSEAFDIWLKENYLHTNPPLIEIWKAAKAYSELEIAKLKDKINDLEKEETLLNKWLDNNKLWFDESEKEKAQLKANINDLRETLKQILFYSEIDWIQDNIEQILEKTPEQSLQEHDNEVIEKCAVVCENIITGDDAEFYTDAFAKAIREMKGK